MRDKKILLLILIVGLASFLRFYQIADLPPGLYPDEAMNGNNALEALSPNGHFKWFYPENNGREGLFINIQALSVYIFGNEPWALRGVSALFGIFTVLGVYFLTKELFMLRLPVVRNVSEPRRAWSPSESEESSGRESSLPLAAGASEQAVPLDRQAEHIALLSAFFLAVSFWHINFSRIGFRAIMAPAFLVWGLFLLLKSLNQTKSEFGIQNSKFKNNWKLFAILGGIFYGLGFHSYIAYRATPLLILIILIFYWFQNKDWQIRKKILLVVSGYTLAAIIVFAPLGYYFIKNPQDFMGRTTQISVFNSPTALKDLTINVLKTAAMFNFSGDYNWRHNYAGKPQLFWPVGILFLIGTLLGLRMFFKKVSRRLSGHGVRLNLFEILADERSRESSGERLAGARDRVFREEYSQAFLILFSWIIIASLPIVISNEGLPHALRAILIIPPVFILAGVGGAWLIEKIKNQISKIKITNQNSKFLKFTSLFYILIFTFCAWLIFNAYNAYFIKWGKSEHTAGAFAANYVEIGRELNALPKELPKYVIVEAGGADVRGIPMPAQTVMFMTDTFTPEKQKERNIFYVLPEKINEIPENGYKIILR